MTMFQRGGPVGKTIAGLATVILILALGAAPASAKGEERTERGPDHTAEGQHARQADGGAKSGSATNSQHENSGSKKAGTNKTGPENSGPPAGESTTTPQTAETGPPPKNGTTKQDKSPEPADNDDSKVKTKARADDSHERREKREAHGKPSKVDKTDKPKKAKDGGYFTQPATAPSEAPQPDEPATTPITATPRDTTPAPPPARAVAGPRIQMLSSAPAGVITRLGLDPLVLTPRPAAGGDRPPEPVVTDTAAVGSSPALGAVRPSPPWAPLLPLLDEPAFPMLLGVVLAVFLAFFGRGDRRDPKLVEAALDARTEDVDFS